MLAPLLPLLLSGLVQPPVHHGIYSGFNLEWVKPTGQNGQVALSVGSAEIDGTHAYVAPAGVPANAYFPYDSPPLTGPNTNGHTALVVGQTYVGYCYIEYVFGKGAPGVVWWATPTNNAFACWVGSEFRPTPDGHPTTPLIYAGPNGSVLTSSALFVGSVVYLDVAANVYYGGNPAGLSVLPFFRNGSQVIYATSNPCPVFAMMPQCIQVGWDLGIPTTAQIGAPPTAPIPPNKLTAVSPAIVPIDFTSDGGPNPLPLSASAIILDSEGFGHQGADTLCFLDPNQPAFSLVSAQSRSCQSEQQLDNDQGVGIYLPVTPFRTHVNIGQSTIAGDGYGEIWVGGFNSPSGVLGKIYFDLAYRGYVEPERQLVSQLPVP